MRRYKPIKFGDRYDLLGMAIKFAGMCNKEIHILNSLEHFHHSCTQLKVSLNQAFALSADIF